MTVSRESERAGPVTDQPTGVWVYGVCPMDEDLDLDTLTDDLGTGRMWAVEQDGLRTVVGEASETPASAAESTALRAHLRVLEALHAKTTLVPAAFGTVLPDEQAIRTHLLAGRDEELRRLLERLAGRVEVIVRAEADDDAVVETVLAEHPDIRQQGRGIESARDPMARLRGRLALGERVAEAVAAHQRAVASALLERLSSHADAVAPRDEEALTSLDAAFLIEEGQLDVFDADVDELAAEHPGWRFRSVGPAPPHHFVDAPWSG